MSPEQTIENLRIENAWLWDEREALLRRLRETIAEWREMGEEYITAENAAAVIDGDINPKAKP